MGHVNRDFWTPERTERLKTLWAKGFSAGLIALELKCTRNAVIGKIHRLGLEWRPEYYTRQKGNGGHRQRNPVTMRAPPKPSCSRQEPVTPTHVRFMARRHNQCAAILNDGVPVAELMVCGAPVPLDTQFQFCREHLGVFTTGRR